MTTVTKTKTPLSRKFLSCRVSTRQKFLERFCREARLGKRVRVFFGGGYHCSSNYWLERGKHRGWLARKLYGVLKCDFCGEEIPEPIPFFYAGYTSCIRGFAESDISHHREITMHPKCAARVCKKDPRKKAQMWLSLAEHIKVVGRKET